MAHAQSHKEAKDDALHLIQELTELTKTLTKFALFGDIVYGEGITYYNVAEAIEAWEEVIIRANVFFDRVSIKRRGVHDPRRR